MNQLCQRIHQEMQASTGREKKPTVKQLLRSQRLTRKCKRELADVCKAANLCRSNCLHNHRADYENPTEFLEESQDLIDAF